MKILYVVMKHDYGVPLQGLSNEHFNFYDTFLRMGSEVLYFDFATLLKQHGRARMNQMLREVVDEEKPDILFCVLYKNEIDKDVMRHITEETDTVTCNWFCDDVFRFKNFSRKWVRCFDWILTVDLPMVAKYQRLGARNVAYVRWACNPFLYHRSSQPPAYDVTFVGQPHGKRREAVKALQEAGINIRTWGRGWEGGRLSQEEMIRVFGQSRINLNFSDTSVRPGWRGWFHLTFPKQIKGRLLEVPACGGFLLTGDAPALHEYYEKGRDVAVFRSTKELVEQVRYYLAHEEERAAIAQAGYARTMREHTYVHRFCDLFQRMGFEVPDPEDVLAGKVATGTTREITITVDRPLVSVGMAVYNGDRFLCETIESILAQTFQDFEFIIVDDGSTDTTPAILAEFAARDARIVIHRFPKNRGKVEAFNAAFHLARAPFIAFMGADDVSLPQRLWTEVNYLQEHPGIGLVGSWVELIDEESKLRGILTHPSSSAFIAWSMFFRNPIAACSVMVRRDLGEKVGWLRETASEDYDFWERLSRICDLANLPVVLARYRVWQGNFTSSHQSEQEQTVLAVIQERASDLLQCAIPVHVIEALRLPLQGTQHMSRQQISGAASLCGRLARAFMCSRSLTLRDRQQIRDSVSDYLWTLSRYAKQHSPWGALFLRVRAILFNPLFLSYVCRR